jgi:hypothetical protein
VSRNPAPPSGSTRNPSVPPVSPEGEGKAPNEENPPEVKTPNLRAQLLKERALQTGPSRPDDAAFQKRYPHLFELLTTYFWRNNVPTDTIRLAVQMGDGDWTISLSDQTLMQTGSVTANTIDEGLKALEKAVTSQDGFWRPWKGKKADVKKLTVEPKA